METPLAILLPDVTTATISNLLIWASTGRVYLPGGQAAEVQEALSCLGATVDVEQVEDDCGEDYEEKPIVDQGTVVAVNINHNHEDDDEHKEEVEEEWLADKPAYVSESSSRYHWQCPMCDMTGGGPSNFKQHLSQIHYKDDLLDLWPGDAREPCPFCNKCLFPNYEVKKKISFGNQTIVKHLGSAHNLVLNFVDGPLRAELEAKSGSRFEDRIKVQEEDKVKCLCCPLLFTSVKVMKQHLSWIHFGNRMLRESESTSHMCGICQHEPTGDRGQARDVVKHLLRMHGYLYKVIPKDMEAELVKLDQGGYKREIQKMNPQDFPEDPSRFKCPYCNSSVKLYSSLIKHLIRQHLLSEILSQSGHHENSNECTLCGKSWEAGQQEDVGYRLARHLVAMHGYLEVTLTKEAKEQMEEYMASESAKKEQKDQKSKKVKRSHPDKETSPKVVKKPKETTPTKNARKCCFVKIEDGFEIASNDALKCPYCHRHFTILRNLENHLASYTFRNELMAKSGSTSIECGICGYVPKDANVNSEKRHERFVLNHLASKHDYLDQVMPEALKDALDPFRKAKVDETKYEHKEEDELDSLGNARSFLSGNNSKRSDWQCYLCLQDGNGLNHLKKHLCTKHYRNKLLAFWRSDDMDKPCPYCDTRLFTKPLEERSKRYNQFKQLMVVAHLGLNHDLLLDVVSDNIKAGFKEFENVGRHALSCPICLVSLKSKTWLENHLMLDHYRQELRSASGSSGTQCGICDRNFSTWRPMLKHVGRDHGFISTVIPPEVSEWLGEIENDDGDETVSVKPKVDCNKDSKDGSDSFEIINGNFLNCPYCDKAFKILRDLKIHLATETFKDDVLALSNSSALECGLCEHKTKNSKPNTPGSDKRLEKQVLTHIVVRHDDYLETIVPENLREALAACKKEQRDISFLLGTIPSRSDWECYLCMKRGNGLLELKKHLSCKHFRKELMALWKSADLNMPCPYCAVRLFTLPNGEVGRFSQLTVASHLGTEHDLLKQVASDSIKRGLEEFDHKVSYMESCPLCVRSLRSKVGVENHLILDHFRSELRSLSNSLNTTCGLCSQKFTSTGQMILHVGRHHGLLRQVVPKEVLPLLGRLKVESEAAPDEDDDEEDDEDKVKHESETDAFDSTMEGQGDAACNAKDMSDIVVNDQAMPN